MDKNKRIKWINDYIHKGFKYAIVGGTGALINWGSIYLFTSILGIWYLESAVLSSIVVMTVNFNMFILWKVIKIEPKEVK